MNHNLEILLFSIILFALIFASSAFAANVFSSPVTITTAGAATATQREPQRAIWQNPRGNNYFYAIIQNGTTGKLGLYSSQYGNSSWTFVQTLNINTTWDASVYPYNNGSALVVYVCYGPDTWASGTHIFYRRIVITDTDTNTPTSVGAEQDVGYNGAECSIARDRNGYVHISEYGASVATLVDIFGTTTTDPGNAPSWSSQTQIESMAGSTAQQPSPTIIVYNKPGNILGVLYLRRSSTPNILKGTDVVSFNGTTYTLGTNTQIGINAVAGYKPFSAIADINNYTYLVFANSSKLVYWNSTTNNTVQSFIGNGITLDAVNPTSVSLSIDDSNSQNALYLFYTNSTVGKIWWKNKTLTYSDNSTWNATQAYTDGGAALQWLQSSRAVVQGSIPLMYTNQSSPFTARFTKLIIPTADVIPPTYSSNASQLVTTYTPSGYSNFSVAWNDYSGLLFGTYLENNFTGSKTNTTMSGSYPNYYYNASALGAGTYQYRFMANDTSGNSNGTAVLAFTINKGILSGSIAGASVTYPTAVNIVPSKTNIVDADVNYTFWRNTTVNGGTLISSANSSNPSSDTTQLGAATYSWILNSTGGANWTSNSSIATATYSVSQNSTNIVNMFFTNSSGTYQNQNITIATGNQTTANVTAVYTQSGTVALYEDGASAGNNISTTLSIGTHSYKGNITGNANYSSNSTGATYYITVLDNIPPNIQLNSPANNFNSSNAQQTFNFTATDNYAASMNCNLTADGSKVNSTAATNSTPTIFVNILSEGTHQWNISCADSSNNLNTSETRTITVDITKPFVSIILPTNISYNTTTLNLNYSSSDLHLQTVWYQYNNANTTLNGNITFTALDNQASALTLFANDSAGNINSTSVTFTVDTTKPTIDLNLPADGAINLQRNLTFNFSATDNLATAMSCSFYIDNILNQANSSTFNNTLTNFFVNGITEGLHYWNVSCADIAGNANFSTTRSFIVNVTPFLTSISASPNPMKGGNVVTITASGIDDPNNDALNLYCSESSPTPNSTNTICTGGSTVDPSPPYTLSCAYAVATDDTVHATYCRVFDGAYYSNVTNTTFITDSTPPSTSLISVAGSSGPTFYDNVNDGWTNMTLSGETSMLCRWGTSNVPYSSMSNDCEISGNQAACSAVTTTQGIHFYNFYTSCRDALGNEQNSSQNLAITNLITDWTAPTTFDNSSSTVHVPPYTVEITEQDNLAYGSSNIITKYCIDTAGTCAPNTLIDSGQTVTFTSANRGINFLRYNSSDPAGNIQSIQNKTININQIPIFASASDNATTIRGGSGVMITTVSSDADVGQTLKLFVCNSTSVSSSGCGDATYCSNTTAATGASCSFASEKDDTAHNWYAFVYDSLNEAAATNASGSYTTVSTPPSITIVNPINQTYSDNSIAAQFLLDKAGSWAGYSLDGAANATMSNATQIFWSATLAGVSDGTHVIRFYTNDSYGNIGTNSIIFSVDTTLKDTTPPSITVNSPSNNSYQTTTVWLNITTDENLFTAAYSLDGAANATMSNSSLTAWYAQLSPSDESLHNVVVYATDASTNRNEGRTDVSFYVDTKAPRYSDAAAVPNYANETQNVTCSVLWTDGLNITSAIISENSTGAYENHTISISGTSGWTNLTIDGSSLSVGTYSCIFFSSDAAGNYNSTGADFTVSDVTVPAIAIRYPLNATFTQNSVTAEILGSENLNWAGYSLDGAGNVTLVRLSGTLWSSTASGLVNGTHTIQFYGNDSSNNMGESTLRFFTIDTTLEDTTPPSITVNSPSNNSYQTTTVWLNITTDENLFTAAYSLDGAANATMSNSSLTAWYAQLSPSDESLHNVVVYATDASTNRNEGRTDVSFYVDTKAPRYSQVSTNVSVANVSQSVECSSFWTDGLNINSGKVAENSTGTFSNHTIATSGSMTWINYTIPNIPTVGTYSCIFYAFDSAGNQNFTSATFAVQDITPPNIIINAPSNSTYTQTFVDASITASENIEQANYSLDGAANVSMSNTSLTIWSSTIAGLNNSAHTLTFYAADFYGNVGTKSIAFTVDTTIFDTNPPVITVFSPVNKTFTSISVLLNITLSEDGSNAAYSLDGANDSLGNASTTNWNKTITVSQGTHTIKFFANDTSTNRNEGNSSLIYFSVDTDAPQNSSQGYAPSPANETVNITCFVLWTDNVALDYGIIQHNETGIATNTSEISLSGTSGWTNLTVTSDKISPGLIQCKAFAFDKGGLANSTEVDIHIADATPPKVENITYLPNTTAGLDPDVLINVTADAKDNVNVSSVMLQYKLSNATDWINQTMSFVAGNTYRGNFTPSEGDWNFRIFANDTSNNINISAIKNISAELDTTWANVSTVPTVKSIVKTQPRFFALGNLILNNTGDFDLNFIVNSSQNWISFNGTGNNSIAFQVNQSLNTSLINVTANTTGFAVGTYNYNIRIYAFALDSSFVSMQTIPGEVVIQNVAGPFLIVTITVYDAIVTQGDSGIILTSTVSNQGTADATETWLNWTLPSDWTNTSGNADEFIGFLAIGSTITNNITASVGSSVPAGSFTLSASAGSTEGATGSDSKTVTVGSPSSPQIIENVGGTSGAGMSTAGVVESILSKSEILTSAETIDLFRGQENYFTINVKNIFAKTTLNNVSLKIEGLLPQYVDISPNFISSIDYNDTKQFNVTITSPQYVEQGITGVTAIINGKIVGVGLVRDFTETRQISLYRHVVTQEEANALIPNAQADLQAIKDLGIPYATVAALLENLKRDIANHQYEDAKSLADQIRTDRDDATQTINLLDEIQNRINRYSSLTGEIISITGHFVIAPQSFSETGNLVNLARAALSRGDYQTALQRAKEAQLTFALEIKNIGGIIFLFDNWLAILVSIILLSGLEFYSYHIYLKATISKRIRNLAKEEGSIIKLIGEAQTKHYKEGTVGITTFNNIMEQYTKRLSKIRKLRTTLRYRRVRLLGTGTLAKDLDEERKEVLRLLENLQKDYFAKRIISKNLYDEQSKAYNERLSEIEDDQLTLETMKTRKEKSETVQGRRDKGSRTLFNSIKKRLKI